MKVFKFGGASVKNAQAVKNTASILKSYQQDALWVVISAMGKTTNALEIVAALMDAKKPFQEALAELENYHFQVIDELFIANEAKEIKASIQQDLQSLHWLAKGNLKGDVLYDQVVSLGEILSTRIVAAYLQKLNVAVAWLDARDLIVTDDTYREGKVQVNATRQNLQRADEQHPNAIKLTQGFIGKTEGGLSTTLGREGSDYTAAIIASCLQAESVTIWKDVPGVMNADPKRLHAAIVFDELPFREAAEMTYYGASVIHPKTIKPLANANIPLWVKNFDNPDLPGTKIHACTVQDLPPLIVIKDNQCLVSCKVTDYSFISEAQIEKIFGGLSEAGIKVNLMQNSAISFSFCFDYRESKLNKLIEKLRDQFEIYYNTNLQLITVKNYDQKTFDEYRNKRGVIMEQSSRSTLQILIKPETSF
ncbi:MAG: aspartate kinase [Cyclobacteriaceae bacterium]|nr:aspartate kinase [Cyclobacteriaceae bacterium]